MVLRISYQEISGTVLRNVGRLSLMWDPRCTTMLRVGALTKNFLTSSVTYQPKMSQIQRNLVRASWNRPGIPPSTESTGERISLHLAHTPKVYSCESRCLLLV